MRLGLEGKRGLVTGGSKGLGEAIARELVAEGARVAICSRSEDLLLVPGADRDPGALTDELLRDRGAEPLRPSRDERPASLEAELHLVRK